MVRLIQVIKKLNEDDQYFIKNITTLREVQVFCDTVQDNEVGEYNYVFIKTGSSANLKSNEQLHEQSLHRQFRIFDTDSQSTDPARR